MARDVWLRRLLLCPKGGQINDRFSDRLFTAQLITRPKSSFPYYTARIPDRNLTYIWKFVVRRFRRYMSETRISRYCIRGKIEMIIDTGHFHRYSLWKPLQSRRIKCSIRFLFEMIPQSAASSRHTCRMMPLWIAWWSSKLYPKKQSIDLVYIWYTSQVYSLPTRFHKIVTTFASPRVYVLRLLTTTETEDKMKSGLFLNVVVGKGTTIL